MGNRYLGGSAGDAAIHVGGNPSVCRRLDRSRSGGGSSSGDRHYGRTSARGKILFGIAVGCPFPGGIDYRCWRTTPRVRLPSHRIGPCVPQLYSATPFSTTGEGMLVLVGARTIRDSYLSLYEQHPDGSLSRPHPFRIAVGPAAVRGGDGGILFLEALLLPSQPEVRYGVYMLCPEATELAFADAACYFLPFAPP